MTVTGRAPRHPGEASLTTWRRGTLSSRLTAETGSGIGRITGTGTGREKATGSGRVARRARRDPAAPLGADPRSRTGAAFPHPDPCWITTFSSNGNVLCTWVSHLNMFDEGRNTWHTGSGGIGTGTRTGTVRMLTTLLGVVSSTRSSGATEGGTGFRLWTETGWRLWWRSAFRR